MVGYMTLEAQVDVDFCRARRKALLRKVRIRLRREKTWDGLLCFDEIKMIPLAAVGRIYRGMRTVPVAQIGGSAGRRSEFDGEFMPATASVEERWKRIDLAFHRGEVLPPVSRYKLGMRSDSREVASCVRINSPNHQGGQINAAVDRDG